VSKRLKKFIYRSFLAALFLGVVSFLYDQIGPTVAGDYFTMILWIIRLISVAVIGFIIWRLFIGLRDGYLLFDDCDD
jgi:ABC-type thiamin/hydroxymethylpyrimidine transport system permease subunit